MKERKRKLQDRLKVIKDAKAKEGKGRGHINETLEQEQENEIERLERLQKVDTYALFPSSPTSSHSEIR